MTTSTLLSNLAARGVRVLAEGGQLRLDAPVGSLTAAEVADLKAHKAELLTLLRHPLYQPLMTNTPGWSKAARAVAQNLLAGGCPDCGVALNPSGRCATCGVTTTAKDAADLTQHLLAKLSTQRREVR